MDSAGGRSGSTNPYHSGGGKRRRSSGATIKARGLPYSTNEYDLVDFFVDFHVSLCIITTIPAHYISTYNSDLG